MSLNPNSLNKVKILSSQYMFYYSFRFCSLDSDREIKETVASPSSKFRENLAGCIISSIMKAVIPNFNVSLR